MTSDYAGIREQAEEHVSRAALATGFASDPSEAREFAAEWYEHWIDKAVDEQCYLAWPEPLRRRHFDVYGLDDLFAAHAAGERTLMVGVHLQAHTLGLVHLDMLGIGLHILVHEQMLPVMGQYGLRNSTWITPGNGFGKRTRSAEAISKIFVTFADIGADGEPIVPMDRRSAADPPAMRLVADFDAVFAWSIQRSGEDGRPRWALTLTRITPTQDGRSLKQWAEDEITSRPRHWMLWRRLDSDIGKLNLELEWPKS
ncbi:hypothetical protein [Nocardia arizonensis]|uniref:hypothetical protein n=1 Tax=Nocardia arizonensis TaxID=1141647 RepID=UPI0007A74F25|nr:hypothetical protein [Nocardia arizonensis]